MADKPEDQPLSSEELLRRAREGLGDGTSELPPPTDFAIESYPPPAPATPAEDFEAPAADLEDDWVPEPPPVVEDTPMTDATMPEAAAPPSSWAPPPAPAEEPPTAWTTPEPPAQSEPAPERRRSAGNAIWVIVVVFVIGMGLFSLFDSSTSVEDLGVGDCMNIPDDDVFNTVTVIDCTEAHQIEIFATIDMSVVSSSFSLTTPYPGDLDLYFAAFDACVEAFEPYVGISYLESALEIDAFTPTAEGWQELDDREVQCLVYQPVSGDSFEPADSIISFRGTGF